MIEEVDFVSGTTRVFAILGDPIAQTRSSEMITAQFVEKGANAIMVPIHAPNDDFDTVVRGLMTAPNVDGLIFTIPFKTRAVALATRLGRNAAAIGSINTLARLPDGGWLGEIFDGVGCVTGIKRAGHEFRGKRVHIIGTGGAGSAISVAIAMEQPANLRVWDKNQQRVEVVVSKIAKVAPSIQVEVAFPSPSDADILINATPIGMLDDPRNPIETGDFPPSLVVFDAIVKPEDTPLLRAAAKAGCQIVGGREMMRGQISRIAEFLLSPADYEG